MARLARTLLLSALLGINAALIGLNLHKHGLFPFDGASADQRAVGGGGAKADASIEDRGAEATTADESATVGPAATAEIAAEAETGAAPGPDVDDWPGGRGPRPDGPPIPRQALLQADGTVTLSGSAPNWAVATAVADNVGRRLPLGIAAVFVDMTWHPEASAQTTGGVVTYDPAILYGSGQVAVPVEAFPDLDMIAALVQERSAVFVVVAGHIDDLGDSEENATVAVARASAVAGYLESQGVDRSRIVVVVAPEDPYAPPNDTDQGRAVNRRVEVRFENFLAPQALG